VPEQEEEEEEEEDSLYKELNAAIGADAASLHLTSLRSLHTHTNAARSNHALERIRVVQLALLPLLHPSEELPSLQERRH